MNDFIPFRHVGLGLISQAQLSHPMVESCNLYIILLDCFSATRLYYLLWVYRRSLGDFGRNWPIGPISVRSPIWFNPTGLLILWLSPWRIRKLTLRHCLEIKNSRSRVVEPSCCVYKGVFHPPVASKLKLSIHFSLSLLPSLKQLIDQSINQRITPLSLHSTILLPCWSRDHHMINKMRLISNWIEKHMLSLA